MNIRDLDEKSTKYGIQEVFLGSNFDLFSTDFCSSLDSEYLPVGRQGFPNNFYRLKSRIKKSHFPEKKNGLDCLKEEVYSITIFLIFGDSPIVLN